MLRQVWSKEKVLKVIPILDEIEAFSQLELLMKDFEYNMINNIYVPAEEELDKYIDFDIYQKKLAAIFADKLKENSGLSPVKSPQLDEKPLEIPLDRPDL